ncbi:Arylsulfatase [Pontiella desulfatans]|uniref:Arylsulfatase n=1 Tax=Pontiella desulfatans TaxID=2750659 RepID=A0A6C2UB86_PONDE|nr:arylsulfatase [Pontiella desulfatans]SPS74081.1 sulfatase S1_15 [Kiritimatiellales bacterium]VGO17432.1 Arylsulfatase [Pontiella desulfatans]
MKMFRSLALFPLFIGLAVSAAQRPNVVIIYGDDVGFADIGINGSVMIPTPNIDQLALEGLNFTDGHCSAATCTPSRFSMLTGLLAFRHNARVLPPDAPLLIPTDKLTLPKLFKQAGYHTAVIGKWHLGIGTPGVQTDWNGDVKPGPLEIGFDYSFLLPSTNDRVPCVYLRNHRVVNHDPNDPIHVGKTLNDVQKPGSTQYPDGRTNRESMTVYQSTHGHNDSVINGIGRIGYMSGGKAALWDEQTISDVFVDEAHAYIKEHRKEPFFLYFASQDIHVPRYPHPRFQGATQLGHRGDAMVAFDWTVGQIMRALKKYDLEQNTIVIFSSDNGPVYDDGYADGTTVLCSQEESDRGHDASSVWRGGKYQIYEGGTRVPFIIRWPAKIKPGLSPAMVNQVDFMASFAHLLGVELPENEAIDSRNILPAFLGETKVGHQYMVEESFGLALRDRHWKYIEPVQPKWPQGRDPIEESLHDLNADPAEQVNFAPLHPEKAENMKAILNKLRTGTGARGTIQ